MREWHMQYIPEEKYDKLHQTNLVPLDIKINVYDFKKEIQEFDQYFTQWGDKFTEQPRYGLPLVNKNGFLGNDPEPACWPLDRWNFVNLGYEDTDEGFTEFYKKIKYNGFSDELDLEIDFDMPTDALSMKALDPLAKLKEYMVRSCILKWGTRAHFKPHFDTWHPVRWLRLWGTTDPDKMYLRFRSEDDTDGFCMWNETTQAHEIYAAEKNIEAGRLYLINTLKWHDAFAFGENVHQFFIALNIDSYDHILHGTI